MPITPLPLTVGQVRPDGLIEVTGSAAGLGANPFGGGYSGINFLHDLFLEQNPSLRDAIFENWNDGRFRITIRPDQLPMVQQALARALEDPVVGLGYKPVTATQQLAPTAADYDNEVRRLFRGLLNPDGTPNMAKVNTYMAALNAAGVRVPTAEEAYAYINGAAAPPDYVQQVYGALRAAGIANEVTGQMQSAQAYQGPNGELYGYGGGGAISLRPLEGDAPGARQRFLQQYFAGGLGSVNLGAQGGGGGVNPGPGGTGGSGQGGRDNPLPPGKPGVPGGRVDYPPGPGGGGRPPGGGGGGIMPGTGTGGRDDTTGTSIGGGRTGTLPPGRTGSTDTGASRNDGLAAGLAPTPGEEGAAGFGAGGGYSRWPR